jgi:hypothetical protein
MADHPGIILLRIIHEKGLKSSDFSAAGIDPEFIRAFVRQRCDLSGDNMKHIARIAAITGTRCTEWERHQANYRNCGIRRRLSREMKPDFRQCLVASGDYRKSSK